MTRPYLANGFALGLATVVGAVAASPAVAQDDVAELGARWGTRPPASYFEARASDPAAFTFERAWFRRNPALEVVETGGRPEVRLRDIRFDERGPRSAAGLRAGSAARAVDGTVLVPLLLGLYSDDGTPDHTRTELHERFFAGPNETGTIPDYYSEISGGALTLTGETFDWQRASLSRAQVTGGVSGLGGASRVGEFITQLLVRGDASGIDWGRYDNDGPDGVPNSGDDDGYVDVLAVVHADQGAECGGDGNGTRVWSHRWSLRSATGQAYVTDTPAANGGSIRVNDYTIQPARACGDTRINDIGVVAHELGHGLGLPDLYAVDDGSSPAHQGIGAWGLMGSGSYGCRSNNSARPCHMSAWSKMVMGWVDVVDVPADTDLGTVVLKPVETERRIWRVPIEGARQYYLLEHRQAIGFDAEVPRPGLLVWYIDDQVIEDRWRSNRINSNPDLMGVRLVEADGRDDLRKPVGNRSDEGDPFPGLYARTEFTAGSTPASVRPDGTATRLTLTGIEEVGPDIRLRLRTETLGLTLRGIGVSADEDVFTVDGLGVPSGTTIRMAPFESRVVEAAGGTVISPGLRRGFDRWSDGVEDRVRTVTLQDADLELSVDFSAEQVRLDAEFDGGRFGVAPGRLVTTPQSNDFWFQRGAQVRIEVVETPGFAFRGLTGEWAGRSAPLDLVLSDPTTITGAFDFVYGIASESSVGLAAGDDVAIELAITSGTGPVEWTVSNGSLPTGFDFDPEGRITGIALATGTWTVDVSARDLLGLEAVVAMTFTVERPAIPPEVLAAPFLGAGTSPTNGQLLWLDAQGNDNGVFDLVDLRRYVTSPAAAARTVETTGNVRAVLDVGTGRLRRIESEGGRR